MTALDDVGQRKPWDPAWRSRTAHRSCDPRGAAILRLYRRRRGWSVSEAARQTGVSRRMIGMLEHAERRPSTATAQALIEGYGIKGGHAAEVWSIALEDVGRASPFKHGWRRGDPDPGAW